MYSKTDNPKYLRDNATGGLINIDDSDYQNILLHRKKNKELEDQKNRLKSLEDQFEELKRMLKEKD